MFNHMKNNKETTTSVDVKNLRRIKRHTKQIAEAVKYPVIFNVFGCTQNEFCHIRLDLN